MPLRYHNYFLNANAIALAFAKTMCILASITEGNAMADMEKLGAFSELEHERKLRDVIVSCGGRAQFGKNNEMKTPSSLTEDQITIVQMRALLSELKTLHDARVVEVRNLRAQVATLRAELSNIANAKRFDREYFDDDTSFADWAQSRARFTLSGRAPK
jgi:hypothetical protein